MLLKIIVLGAVFSTCRCELDALCSDTLDDITSCAADSIQENSNVFLSPLLKFYKCFYTKFLACIPPEWTKVLPSVDQTTDSISYLCNNAHDVDLSCLLKDIQNVSTCVASAHQGTNQELTTVEGYATFLCKYFQVMESCYRRVLSGCDGRTAEILAEYTKYQIPAACDAPMVKVSWNLLVIFLCYSWLKNMV